MQKFECFAFGVLLCNIPIFQFLNVVRHYTCGLNICRYVVVIMYGLNANVINFCKNESSLSTRFLSILHKLKNGYSLSKL
jgi:hypothetical protein